MRRWPDRPFWRGKTEYPRLHGVAGATATADAAADDKNVIDWGTIHRRLLTVSQHSKFAGIQNHKRIITNCKYDRVKRNMRKSDSHPPAADKLDQRHACICADAPNRLGPQRSVIMVDLRLGARCAPEPCARTWVRRNENDMARIGDDRLRHFTSRKSKSSSAPS